MTKEEIIKRTDEICDRTDDKLLKAKSHECLAKLNNEACLEYEQLINDILDNMKDFEICPMERAEHDS